MSNTAEAIVLQYLDAVANKELDRCAELVDPEIRFVGPAMTITGTRDLLAAFRHIGAIHVRSDIKRVFSDGNDVCVIYDFVTDALGALPAIEWVRVEGGRIKSVNLYYDQVPWMKVREELARRASA
jgi:SnoaL-like domain